jgi:hypothetical protein
LIACNSFPFQTSGFYFFTNVKLIEKIGELYGDSKLSNIIVREVGSNPFVFGWTNDTLTQPNCPKDVIRYELIKSMEIL